MKSVFLIKIHVQVLTKVFYIRIWYKCETVLLFFLIRTIVNAKNKLKKKKKIVVADYEKIIELHFVHTWRHM